MRSLLIIQSTTDNDLWSNKNKLTFYRYRNLNNYTHKPQSLAYQTFFLRLEYED